jgi:hypothetical protein
MKKILQFKQFLNESSLAANLSFIFIPLDKNYKSLDNDITNSSTPLPSNNIKNGTVGYALVPASVETDKFLSSPYFKNETYSPGVAGHISFTKNTSQDGLIGMNGEKGSSLTGIASISAEIPGFSQSAAIYLTTGNAFILETLMRREEWDEMKISDIRGRKIGNGFPDNTIMSCNFWGGLEDAAVSFKTILGAASDSIGLNLEEDLKEKYDLTEDLLDLFRTRPGDFMSMNFSQEIFQRISDLAKEQSPEENISKTIDNLSDLKSGGLFDD